MAKSKATVADPKTDQAEGSVNGQATSGALALERINVLVTYRTEAHKPAAVALRRLLQSSMEPAPLVLVTRADKVRPSSAGLDPQHAQASREARVVLSVLTHAGHDRGWLFFEAGTAWARGQAFAVVLTGVGSSELPSSIADFRAVLLEDMEAVRGLVEMIAEVTGCELRGNFVGSWAAFERSREQMAGMSPDDESLTPIEQANQHMLHGDVERAEAMYAEIEAAASTDQERADVAMARIIFSSESNIEAIGRFEQIPDELVSTDEYRYWLAVFERDNRPHRARKLWQEYLATNNQRYRRQATIALSQCCFETGREQEALGVLLSALLSDDRRLRSDAAKAYLTLFADSEPISKLVIAIVGLSLPTIENVHAACELAHEHKWKPLMAYFGQRLSAEVNFGQYAHTWGSILAALGLPALAYEAFNAALDSGFTVSSTAMANLLGRGPVPSAALNLLQRHYNALDGTTFDDHPHTIRAELEQQLRRERQQLDDLASRGRRFFNLVSEFAEDAVRRNTGDPPSKGDKFVRSGVTYATKRSGTAAVPGFVLFADEAPDDMPRSYEFSRLSPLTWIWLEARHKASWGIYRVDADGDLIGVRFDELTELTRVEWDDYEST